MESDFQIYTVWKLLSGVSLKLVIFFCLLITSCSTHVEQECHSGVPCIPAFGEPFEQLSDYSLFKDELKDLNPVEGVLPYDLNTILFSDYSTKQRFIYLPEGTSIGTDDPNSLGFPVGTILVKNFFYYKSDLQPSAGRTLIETRLLIRYEEGWSPNTYVWNQDQTGARLKRIGEVTPIDWTDKNGVLRHVNYRIPSVNDCGNCHRKNGEIVPLGPKIKNLNRPYDYRDGTQNQLIKWSQHGFFGETQNPDELQPLPVWNEPDTGPLHLRARAYLDINCSSCHNAGGSARNSGLFLEYEQTDPSRLGVCKIPVAAGSGAGGLKYGIVPGSPDESILLYRMNSSDPDVRMPEIGRTLIHDEAVELISEWIKTMDLPACDNS